MWVVTKDQISDSVFVRKSVPLGWPISLLNAGMCLYLIEKVDCLLNRIPLSSRKNCAPSRQKIKSIDLEIPARVLHYLMKSSLNGFIINDLKPSS